MSAIHKIKVANGIWWIEVPSRDLRILCGCPADSVKHLMRRGLIVATEVDGVMCETGPNMILLSDFTLQKGDFANLCEFPILQMLYRQGMILPGHPNNTGQKPIIVGATNQIEAQLEYIHRGNYGLVSEQELMDAAVPRQLARDLMRMKIRFAFGQIQSPEDLIEPRILEEAPLEIADGVMLERVRQNQFIFTFEGEKVEINLNLTPDEEYEAAYPLGYHHVKRKSFAVLHSGEGDGWDINRPTMGSILMHHGKIYLIDTGPNIQATLEALGIGIREIDGIFQTHAHDDHFCGLPTFIRSDHKIKYFSATMVRHTVQKKLAALLQIDEEHFSDFFDVHDLDIDKWNMIEGLEVKPMLSPHPVETTIFKFRSYGENGERTYSHFADIVSLKTLEGMITEDRLEPGVSREFYETVKANYLEPATLKKLDIGGGLIHGNAADFAEDLSDKIILSHTALPLTTEQRQIGSEAPFGIMNTLIPTHQDFLWRYAYEHLVEYFPNAPLYMIRTLVNNSIVRFDPKTIIQKEGAETHYVFLLLTGDVEALKWSSASLHSRLMAGAMIGEVNGLHRLPSMATYRAVNFVQALRIPIGMYRDFVERFDLFRDISRLIETREFLTGTFLFGEGMSYGALNRVANHLRISMLEPRQPVTMNYDSGLVLMRSGVAALRYNGAIVEGLAEGDFCNENRLYGDRDAEIILEVDRKAQLFHIPFEIVQHLPIVLWKLLERSNRRMSTL